MLHTHLAIELGSTPAEALKHLQAIKHAMTIAIMYQADSSGIYGPVDPLYSIYQAIYLQAHHKASTLTNTAAGEATAH